VNKCWLPVILTLAIVPYAPSVFADGQVPSESSELRTCPKDLSRFHNEMESLLRLIAVPEFIRTMRGSLTASIPEAILQTDGLRAHILSLEEEIQFQVRVEKSAELIARDVSNNPSGPLEPCQRREKSGYCSAVERYFIAKAANLANRGFLDALRCYQNAGVQ